MTSVLIEEATLDEATIETEVPNLSILPCGPLPPNPAELLHSQKFLDLVEVLRGKYDRLIFDSPPVNAVNDALALGPHLDGLVLVLRARSSRRDNASEVLRQFRTLGTKVIGCVLNAVDLRDESPAYYYGRYDYSARPDNG